MTRVRGEQARAGELGSFARSHLPAVILVVLFASSLALLLTVDTESRVPAAWPAAGLLPGLLLIVDQSRRASMFALGGGLLVGAYLLTGYDALLRVRLRRSARWPVPGSRCDDCSAGSTAAGPACSRRATSRG